jgi:hypothetical protein
MNTRNIVCPISNERIPENLPRTTAFFILSSLALYVFTGFLPIALYLAYDFFVRGVGYSKYSIFHKLSVAFIQGFGVSKTLIDKAPKLFAARLGAIFSTLLVVFHLLGFSWAAVSVAGLLFVLSTLECVVGVCVGCYFYSYLVLPFYQKSK